VQRFESGKSEGTKGKRILIEITCAGSGAMVAELLGARGTNRVNASNFHYLRGTDEDFREKSGVLSS
jgi:hypothetical protein